VGQHVEAVHVMISCLSGEPTVVEYPDALIICSTSDNDVLSLCRCSAQAVAPGKAVLSMISPLGGETFATAAVDVEECDAGADASPARCD